MTSALIFRTFMVAIWSVTLASLKIFQTCLQAVFLTMMTTDYFKDLLYHLSSSTIPNDNSEIPSNITDMIIESEDVYAFACFYFEYIRIYINVFG